MNGEQIYNLLNEKFKDNIKGRKEYLKNLTDTERVSYDKYSNSMH